MVKSPANGENLHPFVSDRADVLKDMGTLIFFPDLPPDHRLPPETLWLSHFEKMCLGERHCAHVKALFLYFNIP
jgi:hypothetical protein